MKRTLSAGVVICALTIGASAQVVPPTVNAIGVNDLFPINPGGNVSIASKFYTGSTLENYLAATPWPNSLPILNGGSGAATASGARANFGAAASGVNNDITSLGNITPNLTAPAIQFPAPYVTLSPNNAHLPPPIVFIVNASGVQSDNFSTLFQYGIASDNLDASAAGGINVMYVGDIMTGASAKGNRTVGSFEVNVTDTSGNTGNGVYYTAISGLATAQANDNGTDVAPRGNVFGALTVAQLLPGATYYNSAVSQEFDTLVETGASVAYKTGIQIVLLQQDAVAGTVQNIAEIFDSQNTTGPGWSTGISFGSRQGFWPMNASGTLIGTTPPFSTDPYTAAEGVDFSSVAFSSYEVKFSDWDVIGGAVHAASYAIGSTAGFSGTKTGVSCTFVISGGIITNVTGC